MKRIAVLLALCLLPACSSGWDKPGTTSRDFTRDDVTCYADAHRAQGLGPDDLDRWEWAYFDYEQRVNLEHDHCLTAKGWEDQRFPHWKGLYFPFF
jgi:hypothetical protein